MKQNLISFLVLLVKVYFFCKKKIRGYDSLQKENTYMRTFLCKKSIFFPCTYIVMHTDWFIMS